VAFFFRACFAFDLLAAARAERFVVPLFVLAMTLTPYVKTALAALILPIFYHPSLHVYEPSGKSFLDVAAGPQLRGDLSEVAQMVLTVKARRRLFTKATESQGRLYRQRHDQSPRLRRELEQHFRQRWRCRRDHDRRRRDPARRMIVHCFCRQTGEPKMWKVNRSRISKSRASTFYQIVES
jgi:hypothetical protein